MTSHVSKVLPFCIVILLCLAVAAAGEISIPQQEYRAGETVQVYISNALVLTSKLALYFNGTEVPLSPFITKYRENLYMVYFDIRTDYVNSTYLFVASDDLNVTFNVTSGEPALRFKPGVVVLDDHDDNFKVSFSSIKGDLTIQIVVTDPVLRPRRTALNLTSGGTRDLFVDFDYENVSDDSEIQITYDGHAYVIPIIYPDKVITTTVETNVTVTENMTTEENVTVVVEPTEDVLVFLVIEESLETTIERNASVFGEIKVQNTLDEPLYDLTYSLTGNLDAVVTLNTTTVDILEAGEVFTQQFWVNKDEEATPGVYIGDLVVEAEGYSASYPISLTVSGEAEETSDYTIFGNFTPIIVIGGETGEEKSKGTVIIGVILIVLLLALIVLVGFKLRQRQEKKFHEYIEETKKKR